MGYTGHRWQEQGDLWLTFYRAYEPELGRWLSEDPIGYGDGLNLLAYVQNRPITLNDPEGLSSIGRKIECGPCDIRVDNDPHKGRHAHWDCRNGSRGCVKPDGSSCEGSGPPPNRVRGCLEKDNFFRRVPVVECGQGCRQIVVVTAAIVLSIIVSCLAKWPVIVPVP